MNNPLVHLDIIGGGFMSDVDEQKYSEQLFGGMKVFLNHFSPLLFDLLRDSGKTVSGKIHKIEFIVYIVVVYSLCLAGFLGCAGIVLAVHEAVYE